MAQGYSNDYNPTKVEISDFGRASDYTEAPDTTNNLKMNQELVEQPTKLKLIDDKKGDLLAATEISMNLIDRIRLSYDNLDDTVIPKIMIPKHDAPPTNSIPTLDADKNAVYEEMPGVTITPVSKDDNPSPYLNIPANEVRFVKETEILVLTTITIPTELEKMSINLMAPIIINVSNCYACQMILEGDYPVKHYIYEKLKGKKK